jgi:glycosyltransferase involved in cell wall biosynthesis
MQGRDFIFTGLQSWDIPIGSNAINIATEISKNNRVLYVNSPIDLMTLLRKKPGPENDYRREVLKKKKDVLRRISDSLWVLDFPFWGLSLNGLPDGWIFDSVNRINNKRAFRYIKKAAEELGFVDPIHFIDNDIYRSFYSKEYLSPALSVYYRRDNLLPMWYWKQHAGRLEPLLIQKCDTVVCNSTRLASFARRFNPRSYDVGQGVELTDYNPGLSFNVPHNILSIPAPRIGYIGDINSTRLDMQLIYDLARSRPDYSFVMVGPEDRQFSAHEMHRLNNLYFTGRVEMKQVPACMSAFHVCLNPQLMNEITMGNYPRKVDEYLAMGKPVIATATETMELFRNHVWLCSSLEDYQKAVDLALSENSPEKKAARIAFAHSHSWFNNVERIYHYIQEALK